MVARRRAKRIRRRDEFSLPQLMAQLTPPPDTSFGGQTWTLEQIRAARDAQLAGRFEQPVRMAQAMGTDDALFTARNNRLDPQRCVDVELVPSKTGEQSRAQQIAEEANAAFGSGGVFLTGETVADIHAGIVDHGIAIGYVTPRPRDDGARVDLEMEPWPLEAVYWDSLTDQLRTRVEAIPPGAQRGPFLDVPIVHGDGRWVVFAKHSCHGWRKDAAILSGSLIWARHAAAILSWAKGATAHGNAKVIGKLPEDVAVTNDDGSATKEAAAMMVLLRHIAQSDLPIGVAPAGSAIEYLTNPSRAWQVWEQLSINAEKAAARVYLGTDGMLGSQGGAPGVDIATLFGVAVTKIQGDLRCIERAIKTGLIEPWCAINFGDSSLAPTRRYVIPDADAEAVREAYGKRLTAFNQAIRELRANQFVVDQQLVDSIAEGLGIEAPTVADERGEIFQYDIELGTVTINEVRERKGFAPRDGGDQTVPERDAAALPEPSPIPAPVNGRAALRS